MRIVFVSSDVSSSRGYNIDKLQEIALSDSAASMYYSHNRSKNGFLFRRQLQCSYCWWSVGGTGGSTADIWCSCHRSDCCTDAS